MFACLQVLEGYLWFVLITLLNVKKIILTLSVSRLLNLLLRLVAFLLFLNPQCLAAISRWITASSSWKRFCLFVCRALSSIMVICMLTAIRLLLTFVMSLYLLLRSYFFKGEDGIRDLTVTGVQTCALPIWRHLREGLEEVGPGEGEVDPERHAGDELDVAVIESVLEREAAARPDVPVQVEAALAHDVVRSEERRVGKECRSRWSPDH